jgi:hypothetical protein
MQKFVWVRSEFKHISSRFFSLFTTRNEFTIICYCSPYSAFGVSISFCIFMLLCFLSVIYLQRTEKTSYFRK